MTKAIISLALACVLMPFRTSGKNLPKNYDYNTVESYFTAYLDGNHIPFSENYTVKPDDIGNVSAKVWKEWKRANNSFREEKLPAVTPRLSDGVSGLWQLPSHLEPDAAMPYYYGSKESDNSDDTDKRRFYIYLHGSGPKQAEWATGLKLSQYFNDSPSVYFVPQIPNEGAYYRWWQKSKQWVWNKLLRQVMLNDSIDSNRIYMFGISEGGYGSQRLASFYADYLAGAGPMAGGEPLINAPAENLRNTAFSLRTGDRDYGFLRNQLTAITGAALDSLQSAHPDGYIHSVVLEPGRGHAIDYTATTPWLAGHVRNPYPRHVNWENFEMDGLYRDGFYNLYVNTRSNPDENSRTYYQMDITGNDIDLRVDNVAYTATKTDTSFGFPIGMIFKKDYTPATGGSLTVYLSDRLVDMSKKVRLTVNGKEVFSGRLTPSLENLVNSCARFFDPDRLYPAAITVDLSSMTAKQN